MLGTQDVTRSVKKWIRQRYHMHVDMLDEKDDEK